MTDKTQGRAIGAVGPGDVKKLSAAGLTVVDTDAYIALRNTAALAKDLEGVVNKQRAELDALRAEVAALRAADDGARERLAAYAHEAWSGWMRYLFRQGTTHGDGSFTIRASSVERWVRQMTTAYADLPEDEKRSDRAEADDMLAALRALGEA